MKRFYTPTEAAVLARNSSGTIINLFNKGILTGKITRLGSKHFYNISGDSLAKYNRSKKKRAADLEKLVLFNNYCNKCGEKFDRPRKRTACRKCSMAITNAKVRIKKAEGLI